MSVMVPPVFAITNKEKTFIVSYESLYYGRLNLTPKFSNFVNIEGAVFVFSGGFSHISKIIKKLQVEKFKRTHLTTANLISYLQNYLYKKRSECIDINIEVIVCAIDQLHYINGKGVIFSDKAIATGMAHHCALPYLRELEGEFTEENILRIAKTLGERFCITDNRIKLFCIEETGFKIDSKVL